MTQKCLGMHRGKSGDAHEEEAMKLEEIHCMEPSAVPKAILFCGAIGVVANIGLLSRGRSCRRHGTPRSTEPKGKIRQGSILRASSIAVRVGTDSVATVNLLGFEE